MEAVMFMMDVFCIFLLVLAIVRSDRSTGEPSLGLFAYKDIAKEKPSRESLAEARVRKESGGA
jgi:hypothetical protein